MSEVTILESLKNMRGFYNGGATHPTGFRIAQLKKLKQALLDHEKEIHAALYTDLKKSPEETYASELGLLLAEINLAIKKLGSWMKPQPAGTDLVNLPSSSKIYRDPLGVVLIIAPWNYPLQLSLIPLVGAISGGNCAMLKPSELAPATASVIEKIIGVCFEKNYVTTLLGDGVTLIPVMMNAFRFDLVFYTGSIAVGKIIYQLAAKELIPVVLELGGKSPAIVEADANLDTAARRIVLGKFLNVGQTCVAPDYLLVAESVKTKLLQKIAATIDKFYGTNPSNSYDYGKIINEKRFDILMGYLQEGAIIYGGQNDRSKLYIGPTLLDQIPPEAPILKEEIFGPLLPVLSFTNTEEAMAIVQRNANPLAFYLFTQSTAKQASWISSIPFGGGCINNTDWHFTNHHLPFGGVGYSGMGAYHGKFTFNCFTRQKPVMKTPNWFDPAMKYPPFKGKMKLFKWFIR